MRDAAFGATVGSCSSFHQYPSHSKPLDKLFFPKELVADVGLCKHGIAFLKHKGCKFHGRKTSLRWVFEYLNAEASGRGVFSPPLQHQKN